ncbi:MAG: hypothetical protein WAR57_00860, partial [Candidatus Phosphoribacter sp.]
IEQIRREHASVNGIRRQLGTGWRTVWDAIRPILQAADADTSRTEFPGYLDTQRRQQRRHRGQQRPHRAPP